MNTTTKDALGSEHPSFSNAEAYSYTFPQSVSSSHPLSTYSDACWGSQMGHTVREGSFLPLFNNHSMSGKIFFWSDGFIAGPIVGLEKTSLSSCEAEICSTDEACKLRLTSHSLIQQLPATGYPIEWAQDSSISISHVPYCPGSNYQTWQDIWITSLPLILTCGIRNTNQEQCNGLKNDTTEDFSLSQ